jgi:transposase
LAAQDALMGRSEETGVTTGRDRGALSTSQPVVVRRRRRYSAEEKRAILKAVAEPGTTVAEVSRRYEVTRSLIHNWRRQEAVGVLGAAVRFTAVQVVPECASVAARGPARSASGVIEIELVDGARIRVNDDVNEAALKRVLWVLRGR